VTSLQLTLRTKALAAECGFGRCGIAAAEPLRRAEYLRNWIVSGRAGTMDYLGRWIDLRLDPRKLLPGARSVIVTAKVYRKEEISENSPDSDAALRGRVARYAWGEDYHTVVRSDLKLLVEKLRAEFDEPFEAKICVDTAPLLERELAASAGIGWIGKNTLVLHPELGSYFFLGGVVTTLEMAPDKPEPDHCGSCTACLDACPTGAFPAPYEMDASRCISYLTIEHRGAIDESLHSQMGDWVFGCDVCQEVCPFNAKAPQTRDPRFSIRSPGPRPQLTQILDWSKDDYRIQLSGSAMRRAKLEAWKRNARIALRNLSADASHPSSSEPA